MFNGLEKMKEKGVKTYQTDLKLEGKVGVRNNEIMIGGDSLNDLVNEVVICYGKNVKIEVKIEVKL